jgi:hypothetical protein
MNKIRRPWAGLKVRIDKTKELGIIQSYDEKTFIFKILVNGEVREYRHVFSVIRDQSIEIQDAK